MLLQDILAVLAGGIVGFSLGLIGGGGSVLAVPLLLYVVGVRDPHVAIGTRRSPRPRSRGPKCCPRYRSISPP